MQDQIAVHLCLFFPKGKNWRFLPLAHQNHNNYEVDI